MSGAIPVTRQRSTLRAALRTVCLLPALLIAAPAGGLGFPDVPDSTVAVIVTSAAGARQAHQRLALGAVVEHRVRAHRLPVSRSPAQVAARLQQVAEPGSVVVGPGTYAATREVMDYDELEPQELKGKQCSVAAWRAVCPDIVLRSTFIVGYPGETEAEFQTLLDWLEEAQLDRVGCFRYENVAGARSNALPDHVPEGLKDDRWHRFMAAQAAISAEKLAAKVGARLQVIVDAVDDEAATCRTMADAPEIDGNLFIDEDFEGLNPGDIVTVEVDEAGEYDLWGRRV